MDSIWDKRLVIHKPELRRIESRKRQAKSTALCCGIPRSGVRVRAVQSSQNPEKAPGFTRAAVGETPRDSRIRLSPNIFSTSSRKGQSAVQRLVRGALAHSVAPCVPANLKKKICSRILSF